jgi:hypothetical protein
VFLAFYKPLQKEQPREESKRRWPGLAKYYSELDKLRYGSLGPASPVRKIDPLTGEVVAIIPAK